MRAVKKICIQTTSQQQNHIKSYNGKLKMIEQYYLLFLMIICVPLAHIGDGINAQDPGISFSLSNSWCFILYHPKISVLWFVPLSSLVAESHSSDSELSAETITFKINTLPCILFIIVQCFETWKSKQTGNLSLFFVDFTFNYHCIFQYKLFTSSLKKLLFEKKYIEEIQCIHTAFETNIMRE